MPYLVDFDPVALQLGPLAIHWYGLMYLLGFVGFLLLGKLRARESWRGFSKDDVDDLLFYGAIGVIVGGRLGYMLVYGQAELAADPLSLFYLWEGGMSFHGGLVGVVAALWLFARKSGKRTLAVLDFITPMAPVGLFFGRIGNFIGGELWGRHTDGPFGVIFAQSLGHLGMDSQGLRELWLSGGLAHEARHPSQLYEAGLEGLVLFVLLWLYSRSPRPLGSTAGLFALGYGCFRFLVEFVREPDAHMGFVVGDWMSTGQLLSLPLIVLGIVLLLRAPRATRDAGAH